MKKLLLIFFISAAICAISNAQGIFRLSPGTEMLVNNNVRIVLNNTSFENNGNIGIASTSRFIFTGNSAIEGINGTQNILFGELEINKPAGILQLNRFVNIFSSVTFTAGNIDLNGKALILVADPNGQLIGEHDNSRIIGNSGFVRKLATLNAPANNNPGNIGVSITSAANLGSTFIERYHYTIGGNNVRRIFKIIPTNNTSLNATLRFKYMDAELGGLDENLLTIWKSTTGTGGWSNQGGLADPVQNTVTVNGINDFNWFAIAPSNAALPVTLSSFIASCNNGGVLVNWGTSQEANTDFFEIQSSLNGSNWSAIAQSKANGNSTTPTSYQYKDVNAGRKYYRLRIVDKDGKYSYSSIQAVNCGTRNWELFVYPNPARDIIELTINGVNRHSLPVKIINAAGQLVWQQQVTLTNQYGKLTIPIAHLRSGIYFIRVDDEQYKRTITISKQ